MTTGTSGYPESHSHLEKQKTSFAFLQAAPLTVADFGWRGFVAETRLLQNKHTKTDGDVKKHRRLRLFHLCFLALAGFPRRAQSSSSA